VKAEHNEEPEMSTQAMTQRKAAVLSDDDTNSPEDRLIARSELRKRSGYHLLGLVGIPLIVAVCLLLQIHKLPNTSLSYSLLNALASVLFNLSSSALLKVFSFLISLLGFSRWFTPSAS
jgi:hypothetical protein